MYALNDIIILTTQKSPVFICNYSPQFIYFTKSTHKLNRKKLFIKKTKQIFVGPHYVIISFLSNYIYVYYTLKSKNSCIR